MKIEKEISSWARALYQTLEAHPEKADEIFANLKKSLNKKSVFIPAILKKLQGIYLKEKTAELFLAQQFSEVEKNEIKNKIKGIVKGIDKVDDVLDESLLAGVMGLALNQIVGISCMALSRSEESHSFAMQKFGN